MEHTPPIKDMEMKTITRDEEVRLMSLTCEPCDNHKWGKKEGDTDDGAVCINCGVNWAWAINK